MTCLPVHPPFTSSRWHCPAFPPFLNVVAMGLLHPPSNQSSSTACTLSSLRRWHCLHFLVVIFVVVALPSPPPRSHRRGGSTPCTSSLSPTLSLLSWRQRCLRLLPSSSSSSLSSCKLYISLYFLFILISVPILVSYILSPSSMTPYSCVHISFLTPR